MSKYIKTIMINKRRVPIYTDRPASLTEDKLDNFRPFWDYCSRMDSRFLVESITIKAVIDFKDRIGFMLIDSKIRDKDGDYIPGAAFLRGDSVVILTILRDEDGRDYVVLTKQPRSPIGKYDMVEIPAGTADGSKNLAGKAAIEAWEEIGLEAKPKEFVDLTERVFGKSVRGIPASCGGSDEAYRVFAWLKKMPAKEIEKIKGRSKGLREEGEKITVEVVRLDGEIVKLLPDAKSLVALTLYNLVKDELVWRN